ncbi:two-component system response regulator [Methylobacillus arboreus]|uniref:response regulator n=1 Tax=Methylobacillus arboreus TaxID=755170 RepID=UPI001E28A827|nr:two-component system response regulator [Methylobacillus arboreus]MCB5191828.1 two-component system response regulator [Methylobacillus arboreus]
MDKIPDTNNKQTILVIDDTPENLTVINALLREFYQVKVAVSGVDGLRVAQMEPRPDLILLDIMMPDIDGYEVCRQIKANPVTENIPVIFLTAKIHMEDEQRGFDVGAVDYIVKPISPPIVLARIQTHLFLKDQRRFLEYQVEQRTREIALTQDVTIFALASLAETRDNETGNHIRRTQHYVRLLAEKLRSHPKFSSMLTPPVIDMIYKSAPLHDLGKVGIPDHILLKPGPLTVEEYEVMKTHARLGANALIDAEKLIGRKNNFLQCAREIAMWHHEHWDGSGYPDGLSGNKIPLAARLMAIADVYDALISERVYKQAIEHDLAVEIILSGRGTHFDPDMVDAFAAISDQFQQIAQQYRDRHIPGAQVK